MNKTLAYYVEKALGIFVGLWVGYLSYKYYHPLELNNTIFAEKLLDVSIALFSFLLVILTLIIQSSSDVVSAMKSNRLYFRLINYNKKVIFLTALVSLLSMLILFFNGILLKKCPALLQIAQTMNLALFSWAIVDTFLYIRIFYKIIRL